MESQSEETIVRMSRHLDDLYSGLKSKYIRKAPMPLGAESVETLILAAIQFQANIIAMKGVSAYHTYLIKNYG